MTSPGEFKRRSENPTKFHYHCLTNSENNVKHVLLKCLSRYYSLKSAGFLAFLSGEDHHCGGGARWEGMTHLRVEAVKVPLHLLQLPLQTGYYFAVPGNLMSMQENCHT